MDLQFEWDEAKAADGEMLPEYDFSDGVRGKHYQAYRRGYQVIIHKADGTTEVRDFALSQPCLAATLLEPPSRKHKATSQKP